jgi:hypothetical protein
MTARQRLRAERQTVRPPALVLRPGILALVASVIACLAVLAPCATALAAGSDIASATPTGPGTVTGTVGANGVEDDVWAVSVPDGQALWLSLTAADPSSDLDLFVYGPTATSIAGDIPVACATTDAYPETLSTSLLGDTCYVDVAAITGRSDYVLDVGLTPLSDLSLTTATAIPAYGATMALTGVLDRAADGAGEGGAEISLYRSADGATWSPLGQALTVIAPAGQYSYLDTTTVTQRTYYRAAFSGDDEDGAAFAPVLRVVPCALLPAPLAPRTVVAGRTFTVRGTVRPALSARAPSVVVRAYLRENGVWVNRSATRARNGLSGSSTPWSLKLSLPRRGAWKLVAYFATNGRNSSTTSAPCPVTVR